MSCIILTVALLVFMLCEVKCRSAQYDIRDADQYMSEAELRKVESLIRSMADDTFSTVNRATHLYYSPRNFEMNENHLTSDDQDMPEVSTGSEKPIETTRVDPWSLVWYVGSFGGLVIFFLAVSCSECCCKKRNRQTSPSSTAENESNAATSNAASTVHWLDEVPPPSYDNFAPPAYDSLFYGIKDEKSKIEVFVVPVHHTTPPSESAPPHPPT